MEHCTCSEGPTAVRRHSSAQWVCGACGRPLLASDTPPSSLLIAADEVKRRAAGLLTLDEFEREFGPPTTIFADRRQGGHATWRESGVRLLVFQNRDGSVRYVIGLDWEPGSPQP